MALGSRGLSRAVVCIAMLVTPSAASANFYTVTVKNSDPNSSMTIKKILWTKNNAANGETAVTWVIPANSTGSRTFEPPAGTTDHGIQAVMSGGNHAGAFFEAKATDAIGLSVDSLGLYIDQPTDSLYVGFDVDGPGSPTFCRSPMQIVSGQQLCSDPRSFTPLRIGSESIQPAPSVPALRTLGSIALMFLSLSSGLWMIARRGRTPPHRA